MTNYYPATVARITGLSLSSLRKHCKTYARYLSPGASQPSQTRYFTDEDVRLLAFVTEQSRQGLPRSEITARLDAGELAAFDWQPPEPPMPPTPEQRIAQLVRRGVMPSIAARAVAAVDARGGRLLTPEEEAAEAEYMLTPEWAAEAEAEARAWWEYTPDVSSEFRRVLDAKEVDDAQPS